MANFAFAAVVPSDAVPLTSPVRWIYVGVTGDVAIMGLGDTAGTVLKAVPAGWMKMPAPVAFIMATGTTATNMAVSFHSIENTTT
jgi:hypothetical protein